MVKEEGDSFRKTRLTAGNWQWMAFSDNHFITSYTVTHQLVGGSRWDKVSSRIKVKNFNTWKSCEIHRSGHKSPRL